MARGAAAGQGTLSAAVGRRQRAARAGGHEAIPAFGTLDLLAAAAKTGQIQAPPAKQLNAALVAARAVDLPLSAPWPVCAQKDGWDPAGYTALTISRPAAWADQAASFRQYQKLIRALIAQDPEAIVAGRVAGWAAAAASGLAWATPPGGRPKAVGALLAWTALNAEPMLDARTIQAHISGLRPKEGEEPPHAGQVLGALLSVADSLQAKAFPDGDGIYHVVTVLADAIRTSADGITTAALVAQGTVDAERGVPRPRDDSAPGITPGSPPRCWQAG